MKMGNSNQVQWELETVVEYDDLYWYEDAPLEATPFAQGGDGIPLHNLGSTGPDWDKSFLDVLLKYHVPGQPDGLSANGDDLVKENLEASERVVGWLDYPRLQEALQKEHLEAITWGLGTYLLLETMAFLANELEPPRVRLVFRAARGVTKWIPSSASYDLGTKAKSWRPHHLREFLKKLPSALSEMFR